MSEDLKKYLHLFKGCECKNELEAMLNFYSSIEDSFKPFCSEFNIHCESGCGKCCEHFVPDLTRGEATCIAYYLLFFLKDDKAEDILKKNIGNNKGPCPFYNPDSSFHCKIYPVRPLTCRLFGSAATRTKSGICFKCCRFIKYHALMPSYISSKLLEKAKNHVPLMNEYGEELINLEENSAATEEMSKAVLAEISRLRLILSLKH